MLRSFVAVMCAATLGACGSSDAGQGDGSAALSDGQQVEALASTLQACSYAGKPVSATPGQLTGSAPSDCSAAVNRIMGFTDLPANFELVSGGVDNAAAVILLDQNRIPRRVIAFNPSFMAAARSMSGSEWGSISVMAHEIAHHLSGHTIVPGGSRPEIELEADKFSGFVLHRMGAPLAEATRMVAAIGSDHASPTYPAKEQRVSAITQGWTLSCQQSGGGCDGAGTARSPAPAVAVAQAVPQPGTIPFKYGRVVVDETGKLDPARVKVMEARLRALARNAGAEFALLVVNDLRGLSVQDYAWAMMRQLRVGKLDVGNGAVVVVAPRQRQAAVAFGPGFPKEAEVSPPDKQLRQWINTAWRHCNDADGCGRWTDDLFNIVRPTLANAARTRWTIQFQTLGSLLDHYNAINEARLRTSRPFDAETDQPVGTLLRLNGRVTSLNPPGGVEQAGDQATDGQQGYTVVGMTTDDGYPVILYVSPRLAGLMPSGALKEGQRYTIVGRLQRAGDRSKQSSALWLGSYDPV